MHKPYSCFGIFYRPEERQASLFTTTSKSSMRQENNKLDGSQKSCWGAQIYTISTGAEGVTSLKSRVRVNLSFRGP